MPSLTEMGFNSFDVDQAAAFNYDENEVGLGDQYVNDIPRMLTVLAASRRRRGIIDECCRKPCTMVQLTAFCPDDYKPKQG